MVLVLDDRNRVLWLVTFKHAHCKELTFRLMERVLTERENSTKSSAPQYILSECYGGAGHSQSVQ